MFHVKIFSEHCLDKVGEGLGQRWDASVLSCPELWCPDCRCEYPDFQARFNYYCQVKSFAMVVDGESVLVGNFSGLLQFCSIL